MVSLFFLNVIARLKFQYNNILMSPMDKSNAQQAQRLTYHGPGVTIQCHFFQ